MQKSSLTALARQLLTLAPNASGGRSAHTVYGGHEHVLRQTLIALTAGQNSTSTKTPARRQSTSCTAGSGSAPVTPPGTAHQETC